jgi:ABC-type antimicrobial peptide transport system permease subunit
MTAADLLAGVVRTLWEHKLRAGLTMFGIAWGVLSMTLMVAAGEGLRVGQKQQAETMGKGHRDRLCGSDVAPGRRSARRAAHFLARQRLCGSGEGGEQLLGIAAPLGSRSAFMAFPTASSG